jgi:hypothetical protein
MKMTVSKEDLIRVANLVIAESNYAVDIASLRGFCIGVNVHLNQLNSYLEGLLGDDYPKSLPDSFLYAEGL